MTEDLQRRAAVLLGDVMRVYLGSNGQDTTLMFDRLRAVGHRGLIAVSLFRASKSSGRAKVYRGGDRDGSWRAQAYARKDWSLEEVSTRLARDANGMTWGWGRDLELEAKGDPHVNLLYVDLPTGQVSFHCAQRYEGPAYGKSWDGIHDVHGQRVCSWAALLLAETEALP